MSFWRQEEGSQLIEFSFVIVPLFAFAFLIMDVAWVVFAKASLQYAAREGVRYAVTSQTVNGLGQDDSIRAIVQKSAFGFVGSADAAKDVSIAYYDPNTLAATNANAGGNVVEVSITGVNIGLLGPILRDSGSIQLSARSSDVMEGSPGGIPPKR